MTGYYPYYSCGVYSRIWPEGLTKPFKTVQSAVSYMRKEYPEFDRLIPNGSWIGVSLVYTDPDGGIDEIIAEIYEPMYQFYWDFGEDMQEVPVAHRIDDRGIGTSPESEIRADRNNMPF